MFTLTPAVFSGLPAHKPRILIVTLRDLGDALLAASLGPALRFLRPDAETWLLTFRRNASIIEGVPGIDGVITVEDKPNLPDLLSDLRHLWNRFEWSVCTLTSDRALYYGYAAGRKQVMHETSDRLRRKLISDRVPLDDSAHQLDRIAALLAPIAREAGKTCVPEVHPYAPYSALSAEDSQWCRESPFVVLHMSGKYSDKDVAREVWRAVAKSVVEDGFRIALRAAVPKKKRCRLRTRPRNCRPNPGGTSPENSRSAARAPCFAELLSTSASTRRRPTSRPRSASRRLRSLARGRFPAGVRRRSGDIVTTATSRYCSARTA